MVHSLPDITAVTGTKVPLTSTHTVATWFQVQAPPSGNQATARVGDASISATQGAIIATNGYQFFPTAGNTSPYNLEQIYVLGTTGDTFSILYEVA